MYKHIKNKIFICVSSINMNINISNVEKKRQKKKELKIGTLVMQSVLYFEHETWNYGEGHQHTKLLSTPFLSLFYAEFLTVDTTKNKKFPFGQ